MVDGAASMLGRLKSGSDPAASLQSVGVDHRLAVLFGKGRELGQRLDVEYRFGSAARKCSERRDHDRAVHQDRALQHSQSLSHAPAARLTRMTEMGCARFTSLSLYEYTFTTKISWLRARI